jgi:chromosomal replication initiation ATPase DnaA
VFFITLRQGETKGKRSESLKEIGKHFGIGASGVSQTSRRIAMRIGEDNKLRENVKKIENKMNLSRVKT